jgi:PAS domain S-box-containing protein
MDSKSTDGITVSPPPLRVLILEDNPRDAKLTASVLESQGCKVQFDVTDSQEVFRERLEKAEYDVIVSDFNLRDWTAMDALEILKCSGKDVPLIVVTGSLGDEASVECIKQGAADFVLKDRPARLPTAVQRALEEKRLRTQNKQALEVNSRLAAIVESSDAAILSITREGLIDTWNAAAERMYGYTEEEIQGKHFSVFIPEARRGEMAANEERLFRGEPLAHYELENIRKDGSVFPVSLTISPIKDATGFVTGVSIIGRDITERKRAEEALIEERHLLHTLMDNIPDLIYFKDRESHFTWINKALAREYGLSDPAQAVGKTDLDFYAAKNAKTFQKDEEEIIRTGQPIVGQEEKESWPDGHATWVSTTKMPLRDANGNISGTFGVSRDLTERKRAEDELYQSRQMLKSILDTIPQRVFWKDRNIVYLGCNKALAIDAGLKDPAEIIGKNDYELAWRETAEDYRADDKLVMEQDAPRLDYEEIQNKPDGSLIWLRTSKLPLHDQEGKVIGMLGTYEDITERKRAEAERTRLITAIEQSAEAVVITDTKGVIEYVNPAFTWITGYSREEALGQNTRMLKSGKQDPGFYQQLWATVLKGEVWHGELINQRKDGKLYTEEMNITPVRDARGKVTHFIATKQDVTERKSLEMQVRQAAKMEAVGRLAGGVAHDFNNLLTIINGYSEILLEKFAPDSSVSIQLREINNAGERAASLTRQLLAFSRRQVLAPQVLDLNGVVSNLEKMLRRLIGEDVELRTVLHPSLGRVQADPGQIEQVIMNLVVNARDAMPSGGCLTIETSNEELDETYARNHVMVKPGPHVLLAVGDTGMGMAPETKVHIFEPFFTTKEQGKGTGLGLATVYGIVQQSGGSIWVYSELGQGTVFKIYFPIISESPAASRLPKTETDSASGSETILVVEDEEGVRSLVHLALVSSGYTVLETKDGESALATCANHAGPIHLLVTDVVMPQMSGPKVAEKVAALRPGIKVLYMSGYTDDAVVHHGVLSHDMPFIQKPFSPLALRKKIREVLGEKREGGLRAEEAFTPNALAREVREALGS